MVKKQKFHLFFISSAMLVIALGSCKEKSTRKEIGNDGIIEFTTGQSKYYADYEEAERLMQSNKNSEAISIYKRLCKIEDESQKSNAYVGLGSAYLGALDYEKAIESYKNSITLENKNTEAYVGLGTSYFRLNDYNRAIKYYGLAKQIDSNNSDSYWGLAIAYDAINSADSAKINARRFIKLEPNSKYKSYLERILNK